MARDGNIPGAIAELERGLAQTPRAQEFSS
jgi:hypothetical protein